MAVDCPYPAALAGDEKATVSARLLCHASYVVRPWVGVDIKVPLDTKLFDASSKVTGNPTSPIQSSFRHANMVPTSCLSLTRPESRRTCKSRHHRQQFFDLSWQARELIAAASSGITVANLRPLDCIVNGTEAGGLVALERRHRTHHEAGGMAQYALHEVCRHA